MSCHLPSLFLATSGLAIKSWQLLTENIPFSLATQSILSLHIIDGQRSFWIWSTSLGGNQYCRRSKFHSLVFSSLKSARRRNPSLLLHFNAAQHHSFIPKAPEVNSRINCPPISHAVAWSLPDDFFNAKNATPHHWIPYFCFTVK